MITYIEYGDIFKLEGIYNYAHGCNCAGAMGKGIAIQFKETFPEMYKEYKKKCTAGTFKLGDVFVYRHLNGYVFNLATQETWRTKANILSIEQAIKSMLSFANESNINQIALPKIGAGLGGLNWQIVKYSIEKIATEYSNVELFVVENYKDTF
jgi:O-acetyl-ADP-ribose deacetylase (regulator of RNase III)